LKSNRREAVFHPEFRAGLKYWVENHLATALRVLMLVDAIMDDPFVGIGKPEPMKHMLAGVWSRRVSQEHRITYRVSDDRIDFLQARLHY
jgi:toxin YoeB